MGTNQFSFRRKALYFFPILVLLISTLVYQGCGGGGSSGDSPGAPAPAPGNNPPASTPPVNNGSWKIQFNRIKNSTKGQSFTIHITGDQIAPSQISQITLSKGTLGPWIQIDASNMEAIVTPDAQAPTGKYNIKISAADGSSYERTPLVLNSVNDRWNQPELFQNPVSTEGWEDSPQVFVAKDAQGNESLYLALVYIPIRFDCAHHPTDKTLSGSVNNPYCAKIFGPYQSPIRPKMSIAPFVAADGTIDQQLPALMGPGFIGAAKMGATMYVFKMGSDNYPGYLGTPSLPQPIYIENDDGYSTESGPFIFKNGNGYSMMYHFDKLIDTQLQSGPLCPGYASDTGVDAYILGNYDFNAPEISLGRYTRVDPGGTFSNGTKNTGPYPCPELILQNHIANGIQTAGMQDNPIVYFPSSGQPVVLWDNEAVQDAGGNYLPIMMQVLANGGVFPTGPWTTVNGLSPLQPSSPGTQRTQPMFTNDEFCTNNNLAVECSPFSGNPTQSASYGAPVTQLTGVGFGINGASKPGQIGGVGEPTIFTYKGQKCLSFIAGTMPADLSGNFNMDIAWVCQ